MFSILQGVMRIKDKKEELDAKSATKFRRGAAMLNYMSQDRPDLSFSYKEISRGMAKPTAKDVVKLKRAIRYLSGHKHKGIQYMFQYSPNHIKAYSDSDWAGCVKTRNSTSGGILMYGAHLLHHWSSTQSVVALSSAEAELNAIVRAMAETLGLVHMMDGCSQRNVTAQVLTDSSAANGIVHRQGCGKVKHLECRQLWVQSYVGRGEVQCTKVPRAQNPSDALTHYWTKDEGVTHFGKMQVQNVFP